MSNSLDVRIGIASESGKRQRNEDFAAALADGIGGAKGGREAAEITVRGFLEGYFEKPESFGIRRAASEVLQSLNTWIVSTARRDPTPLAEIPGTASYMAPELFEGKPGSEASDLYALAVTLFRLFTGHYPYGEIEPFSHPRFGQPASLAKYRPDLPAWLDALFARALSAMNNYSCKDEEHSSPLAR